MFSFNSIPPTPPTPPEYQTRRLASPENEEEEVFYSYYNLQCVTTDIDEWTDRAHRENINIRPQLDKIQRIVDDMPQIHALDYSFSNGIILVYQNKMRRFYLCEIIREFTLQKINRAYESGKSIYAHKPDKLAKVEQCFNWIMKKFPPEISILLDPIHYEGIVRKLNFQCTKVLFELNKMVTDFK